ncbi:MAG TPA: SURF1 family protein [Steroidobacteraceae bacterium]|nr:SURF1 family protein [Steroidobacteraceae bacterium]
MDLAYVGRAPIEDYIVTIKFGSRVFAPRLFTTLLTGALLVLLLGLGRWQLHRAAEKQQLVDEFAAGADATRQIDAATPRLPRYQHVRLSGRYDGARQFLIDNMESADGLPGYYVVTPFALQGGGWILVNRGWVPLAAGGRGKPPIPVSAAARTIRGRADELPRPGIRLSGAAALAPPYPVVAEYPRLADIEGLLREPEWAKAAPLVLLDPDQADGYLRQWSVPGFPPIRYTAYAVQWFALALTLAIIYVVTNLHRSGDREKP